MPTAPSGAARPRASAGLPSLTVRDLLARVLWGEARGEGRIGMQAVASVIVNRAHNSRWWGRDLQSVCTKPWQFSCLLPTDPNLPKLLSVTAADPAFRDALAIADDALAGRLRDITNGADHYLVTAIQDRTAWAKGKTPVAVIGGHSFFRLELPALAAAPVV